MFLANWIVLSVVQLIIVVLALAAVVFIRGRATTAELAELKESGAEQTARVTELEEQLAASTAQSKTHEEQLIEARAEIERLTTELAEQPKPRVDEAQEDIADLKKLLLQFTLESRDLLDCIDALQRDNAQLKAELEVLSTAAA